MMAKGIPQRLKVTTSKKTENRLALNKVDGNGVVVSNRNNRS